MSIRVAIRHTTQYLFDRSVALSPHVVRLRPAPHCRTPIEAYSLKVTPQNHFLNWQQDPFGNYLARLVFPERSRELTIDVEVIANLTVINPFDFFVESYAELYPFEYEPALKKELTPYLEITETGPCLQAWLDQTDRGPIRSIDFLVALNQRLQRDIRYLIRLEPGIQTCEETLTKGSGSCRDSGWLLVQILRHLGYAARFVSGYLVQLKPDEIPLEGPAGTEQDFTDLHAWAEVYVPGAGWLGLDPTSGLFAGEGHIPLACTPGAQSAAPISGATDKCEVVFSYRNEVTRIHEDPRVTKPYSEDEWATILALGELVDERLLQGDVRLTMGGEPTFVSIDDMDSPEWNTEALGSAKRAQAEILYQKLRQRFAPYGLMHYGQGKWYPGEPLPRWSLNLYWRKDGQPIWTRPDLLANPADDLGHDADSARRFIDALARQLRLNPGYVLPAYEDGLYYLWQEARVSANRDPAVAFPEEPNERQSLANKLSAGIGNPTGFVLPVQWDWGGNCWSSGPWPLRRNQLYLTPGDSPIGLRLPLDSLPWLAEDERPREHPRDPFDEHPPLRDFHGEVAQRYSHWDPLFERHPEISPQMPVDNERLITAVPHTALCTEVRGGCLHLFLPPVNALEHYLELIAAAETVAASLEMPIVIEGYPPPRDARIAHLAVTPDPGVIEVNVHPAASWKELVANTTALYDDARLARLGTEKFMLDGRHTGTGGGNHVALGAAFPSDSPFLRRPDLLQSMLTFWQHHPSLSYLFSGLFIGPTSQAPRIDEARNESLYELEIAFQQIPLGMVPQPWLVDRLFRNLLVDISGNTHRAEFCIDKLYSPDTPTGRQGLLEFRGFEMPPHARMSLVQMLLLRALIVRFWEHPYRHRLVRWGTELHDRFMLPFFVWSDFREVIQDLNEHGLPLQLEWFAPFLEFRFPLHGRVQIGDVRLELHAAIEPWHVLGEEVTNVGTARFVDSSVERLQVLVEGLTPERHVVACNGRRVPLTPTTKHGQYVAGVRYRAWQPPSALHPYIGTHSPLVFDLIDTWNGRSIGGCTYHVMHAGGRNYQTLPVNAFEAESRRITRFWGFGHTQGVLAPPPVWQSLSRFVPEGHMPGPMPAPVEEGTDEYPHTLDLRRQTS